MAVKPGIILIGGGGHCLSTIDVIEQENKYLILDPRLICKTILSYPVLGDDSMIPSLIANDTFFLITIGQIKSYALRKSLAKKLEYYKAAIATVVSPRAYCSKYSSIGKGSVIFHDAVINAGAVIGSHCIINTKADIEHGVTINDFCHISTAAVINGDVTVGGGSFVGSNAVIAQGISLGGDTIISAGAFIKK